MTKDTRALNPAQRYRLNREAAGEAQIVVWLNEKLRSDMDQFVAQGGFKNRSELVAQAVNAFLEGRRM